MGKLLIVDDDESLRRLMRLELSDAYDIVETGKSDEGLALAMESKPDAILLDLRMPTFSGFKLLQAFASFGPTQTTPVIIVSGEAGGETKENCKQLGAAAYFEKPIDFEALREYLSQVAKPRRRHPLLRCEPRVQLRISLKVRGTDIHGNTFEEATFTDDVSVSGFQCSLNAEVEAGSILNVYLAKYGDTCVGKARIAHSGWKTAFPNRYGCQFTEKTGPWVLQ